jgi:hypothetical protein
LKYKCIEIYFFLFISTEMSAEFETLVRDVIKAITDGADSAVTAAAAAAATAATSPRFVVLRVSSAPVPSALQPHRSCTWKIPQNFRQGRGRSRSEGEVHSTCDLLSSLLADR